MPTIRHAASDACPTFHLRRRFYQRTFIIHWTKVFWYFTLPMVVSIAMLAMYFSGVRVLETIVAAPYFEAVPWNSRREFGLLENLQNLILLGVVGIAVSAVIKHHNRTVKAFMVVVAIGATLLFLEEIDYGLHYYEYLAEVPHHELAQKRNLHTQGDRTSNLKTVGTIMIVIVFGIAPFALAHSRHPLVRYFRPDPYMALMLIVAYVTRTIAHALNARGMGHGLEGNLSEFRELIIYYMGLAYTLYLVRQATRQSTTLRMDRFEGERSHSPERPCHHRAGGHRTSGDSAGKVLAELHLARFMAKAVLPAIHLSRLRLRCSRERRSLL